MASETWEERVDALAGLVRLGAAEAA
jgi:hypothetical protein